MGCHGGECIKTTASSLIGRGRPAERHLLPQKLFIKSQLSFCKHFIENKICKLISCEWSPGLEERRKEGAAPLTLTFTDEAPVFLPPLVRTKKTS